jgi:hypothetical protein
MLILAALLMSGTASAQLAVPSGQDAVREPARPPDRPPAATSPDTNKPSPQTTGEAPDTTKKTSPESESADEMDSVGGRKSAPDEEKK